MEDSRAKRTNRTRLTAEETASIEAIMKVYEADREEAKRTMARAQIEYTRASRRSAEQRDDALLKIIDAGEEFGRGTQARVAEIAGLTKAYMSTRVKSARARRGETPPDSGRSGGVTPAAEA